MFAERWVQEDNSPPPGANFYVGVDLGQSQDFTALSIIERIVVLANNPSTMCGAWSGNGDVLTLMWSAG